MPAKYELRKTSDNQFRFTLVAPNGETLLTSESYKDKNAATGGIKSCVANASAESQFERKVDAQSKAYFVLKAKNKQVIGTSESYSSNAARDDGIRAVMIHAPLATVSDLTRL